jgi:threonine dehydratase
VTGSRLSLERIERAPTVIDPVFLDSPQYVAESLGRELGCRVVVKVETLNPIRSFKGRGTELLVSSLTGDAHLVCASAGNFGQGMAWSGRKRGLPVTVFCATTANPLKIERMRSFGAEVRPVGRDFDEAHHAAVEFARANGARLIEDGRNVEIAEGAGTIGVELTRWPEPLDSIVVPLGDGALLAGIAAWVKAKRPATQMVGVCAAGAPAMERSWRAGRVRELPGHTIADGIEVTSPFAEALSDITGVVDDVLLVEDDAIVSAIRLAHRELGVVLEPAGAAALAAVVTHPDRFRDRLVAVLLTGGNATAEQLRTWLAP